MRPPGSSPADRVSPNRPSATSTSPTSSARRDPAPSHRTTPLVLSLVPAFLLAAALALGLIVSPELRGEVVVAWDLLRAGDPEGLRDWMLAYGAWAPILSALLQVATSVFPPGPSFLLSIANAMVFGAVLGGLLTFVTALGAAAICFGIARVVGRPGVERLLTPERLERMDAFMERHGILAVFLGRLIPFVNPDLVSYAAGVTRMGWLHFLVGMAAGALPATVFYSVIGATAVEATGWVLVLVGIATILPLFVLALVGRRFLAR